MTTHLVTFSDDQMSRSRRLCAASAREHGVDTVYEHAHDELSQWPTVKQNPDLFQKLRGRGYWAWKPLLINSSLHIAKAGDVVIYADAGVEFINNVDYIIDRMDQDIFLFGNNWEHAHWCKADVPVAIWPEHLDEGDYISQFDRVEALSATWSRFGKQCQASVIFFRVSDYSRKFVAEWLKWCLHRERVSSICSDEWRYLIDDSPSVVPNHPEFREHRHDQAILTTLAYREGIKLHYWPAVYNKGGSPEFVYEKLPEYAGDDYPVLFSHHRRRNHEWENAA